MPSHNETKIHVSTNLHVCIENLDEGGERKRKKYMRRSKKRTGLQPKNVFEKKGGWSELLGFGLESGDDVPDFGAKIARSSLGDGVVLVDAGLVLFVEERPGECKDGG